METYSNIVCAGCTCLCDDIQVARKNDTLDLKNACHMGEQWFSQVPATAPHCVDQRAVEFDAGIEAARQLMANSLSPLICGLDHLSTAAQQSAWRLADRAQATIDTTLSDHGRGSSFALQRIGKVTATLGEVACRSDVVVFWFCDPATTHPRHLERYSQPQHGPPRKIIVVDDQQTSTTQRADEFIQLKRDDAILALVTLRSLIANEIRVQTDGVPQIQDWKLLAKQLTNAKYGAIFYGHAAVESPFDYESDLLAALIRELNQQTRLVGLSMREDANSLSAENVISWSSGFPFAVNLNRRFPRSCWLEYSAETLLSRGECDLVLLASTGGLADSRAQLSSDAKKQLDRIAKIVVAETETETLPNTAVQFSVSRPGLNIAGDYCRQDDVSLKLSNLYPDQKPFSANDVLDLL